jgi:competence protein ComFC
MDILDLIFPKVCLECKKQGKYICSTCLYKLPPVKQICSMCQRPSIDGFTHPKCLKPQSLNGLLSIWPYKGVIRRAIISLKYKFVKEVSGELSDLSVLELKRSFLFQKTKDILTTVPLFWTRKNLRGYNQVDELGKSLAKSFSLSFYPDLLIRKKLKDPQVILSKKDRVRNVQGVFALNPLYKQTTKDASVTIVDDVFTTGSTLKEMSKVLKRNGVKEVWGLTIAR